jgi:hypothetical protein
LINRTPGCISAILSGSNVHVEHANEISNIARSWPLRLLSVEVLNKRSITILCHPVLTHCDAEDEMQQQQLGILKDELEKAISCAFY